MRQISGACVQRAVLPVLLQDTRDYEVPLLVSCVMSLPARFHFAGSDLRGTFYLCIAVLISGLGHFLKKSVHW